MISRAFARYQALQTGSLSPASTTGHMGKEIQREKKRNEKEEILPTSSKLLIYNTALHQNLAHKEQGRDVLKKPAKTRGANSFSCIHHVYYIYIKDILSNKK